MARGFFITLEGGEGAGKSTQIKRLESALKEYGHDVLVTREPGGTPEGEALRDVWVKNGENWLPKDTAILMTLARSFHVRHKIKPAIEAGQIVICDRFTDSTRAYQGIVQGLGLDVIDAMTLDTIGAFEPDLTFIFDIDPQIGLSRTSRRKGQGETFDKAPDEFHHALRDAYLQIADMYPKRCVVIDAEQSIDEVFSTIMSNVKERLS